MSKVLAFPPSLPWLGPGNTQLQVWYDGNAWRWRAITLDDTVYSGSARTIEDAMQIAHDMAETHVRVAA